MQNSMHLLQKSLFNFYNKNNISLWVTTTWRRKRERWMPIHIRVQKTNLSALKCLDKLKTTTFYPNEELKTSFHHFGLGFRDVQLQKSNFLTSLQSFLSFVRSFFLSQALHHSNTQTKWIISHAPSCLTQLPHHNTKK